MLNDDLIKRTRHSVKNVKDKVRILKNKGVTTGALPKIPTAKYLLKAYENNPVGLRKRLKEFDDFTTKGKIYKTEGGITLTHAVKVYKNREIRRSQLHEQALVRKAEKAGLVTAEDHANKAQRLMTKIEKLDYSDLRMTNYAITNPEGIQLHQRVAVENFMKGLNFGYGFLDNGTFVGKQIEDSIKEQLSELTEDEINDLMETNQRVKNIMNYYRERKAIEEGRTVKFSGGSVQNNINKLEQELPEIVKRYKRLRR